MSERFVRSKRVGDQPFVCVGDLEFAVNDTGDADLIAKLIEIQIERQYDRRTLRGLQLNLPWGANTYGAEYDARTDPNKEYEHLVLCHLLPYLGRFGKLADRVHHAESQGDAAVRLNGEARELVGKTLWCLLRLASIYPGGAIDVQSAFDEAVGEKMGGG